MSYIVSFSVQSFQMLQCRQKNLVRFVSDVAPRPIGIHRWDIPMRHLYPTLDGHIRRVYVRCPGKLSQVDEGHQHLAIEANLSAHRMDAKHHWTSKCWFRENPLHEETSPYLTMLLQRPQVFVSNPLGTLSKRRHKLAARQSCHAFTSSASCSFASTCSLNLPGFQICFLTVNTLLKNMENLWSKLRIQHEAKEVSAWILWAVMPLSIWYILWCYLQIWKHHNFSNSTLATNDS